MRTQNAIPFCAPFQGRTSERSTCKNAPAAAEHTFISAPAHKHTHAHTHGEKKNSLLSRAAQQCANLAAVAAGGALESCDATDQIFYETNYALDDELEHVSRERCSAKGNRVGRTEGG